MFASLFEKPDGDVIDWEAESPRARFLDTLLFAHLFFTSALVVVMRGWRIIAFLVGLAALALTAIANSFEYFAVTGVYW